MLILYFLTLPCIAFAVPSFVPVPGLGWVRAPGAGVAPAQGFVSHSAAVHWPVYGWNSVSNAQHKLQGWCCGSDPPAGREHRSVWRGSVELSSKVWSWLFFCSGREQQSVCKEVQTLSCHGSHGSFLISFYFWDPKVLAVLGWVVHPDLSALFCKSNDIQAHSRMFQGLPYPEWCCPWGLPGSSWAGRWASQSQESLTTQAAQQSQRLGIVLAVPGDGNLCFSLPLAVIIHWGGEWRAAGITLST